jgi:hypothetical protein
MSYSYLRSALSAQQTGSTMPSTRGSQRFAIGAMTLTFAACANLSRTWTEQNQICAGLAR